MHDQNNSVHSSCLGACSGPSADLTHSQQINSFRSAGVRGIKKDQGSEGSFMAGDNSLISFSQFFELMKNKTHNENGTGGIDFEHNEKNVSCFLFPIFGN